MATSKTLTPTNVTISIPEFTDQPDQRVNSNCIDKEADAINALNTAMLSMLKIVHHEYNAATFSGSYTAPGAMGAIIIVNAWNTVANDSGIYLARLNNSGYSITPIKAPANATVTVNKYTVSYTINSTYTDIFVIQI